MKRKITATILTFLLLSGFLMGCANKERGPQLAKGFIPTLTPTPLPPTITPRPTNTPRPPTPEPLQLSSQRYALSSGTMTLLLPVGWELQIEDKTYIRVSRPDGAAWLEAAVDSSGYELSGEHFSNYVETSLASLYGNALNYEQQKAVRDTGYFEAVSTFQIGETVWHALDVYSQHGKAIFIQSFQAEERYWERYLPVYREILAGTEQSSGYIGGEFVYQFERTYTAPNDKWTLRVPLAWRIEPQEISVDGARAETITSPDGEAVVQVILLDAEELLAETDIGQITINMLKDLEGEDLHTIGNAVLNDKRLRVDWETGERDIYGITYFWLEGVELNTLTMRRTKAHVVVYKIRFDEMAGSFRRK